MPKHYHGVGNKVYDHEPVGHPALQKPRSKGGIPVVTRDNAVGASLHGPVPVRSDYGTHIKFPGNKEG